MKQFLWLGSVLFLFVICVGCGQTFRPIIIPNPAQFPNPQAAHTVVTVSDNGAVSAGYAMVIDVSGDADVSQKSAGLHPVHAVQQAANQVLVISQAVAGVPPPPSGCVVTVGNTQDNVCPTLTKLNFSGTVISAVSTLTLPPSSGANFVATTETGQAYISLPTYVPDPVNNPTVIVPSIYVVNTTANSFVATIPVGTGPAADPYTVAETPDGTKLYVGNHGDGTVDGFNTKDRSSRTISGSFVAPVWISARSDNQRVYVLNGNGNGVLSTLDTHLTAGPDSVIDSSINVPGATYMWYDMILNRLYIPYGGQLAILDVSQSVPAQLVNSPITISTLSPALRSSTDPCATTSTELPLTVASVTSLPDGSRAYVGSYYIDNADNVCPQVTVITTSNNTVKTTVPIPGFPEATNPNTLYYVPACTTTRDTGLANANGFRMTMGAAGDSTRAYLASCDGGNVNLIDTTLDAYVLDVPAPYSARAPIPPSAENPPQSPVFMIAGP
jgi:hypothetical protein